jgi:superfamily II DNA/RNA helicase
MDIPNISTIVNWGATSCSLSTIWQRFGRCVRNQALEGIAILFTEKDNLDPEREKKAEKAKQRKRSSEKKQGVDLSNKRQKTIATEFIKTEESTVAQLSDLSSEDEQEVVTKQSGKSSKRKELDPDVDELINAGYRGQTCRRIPIMTPFRNDQSSSSYLMFYFCILTWL